MDKYNDLMVLNGIFIMIVIMHIGLVGSWSIQNRSYFKFIPTDFCNTRNRKTDVLLSKCKTKEDICNSTEIGILDKMLLLMKFDPLHYLNYKRLEKEEVKQLETVNI
jgi:hypothetical protein